MADQIKITISADDQASGKIKGVEQALAGASGGFSDVQAAVVTMNAALGIAQQAFAALKSVVEEVVDIARTTDEFVKLRIALETLSGSAGMAKDDMAWLQDFVKTAPIDLHAASQAFIQLRSVGIDPTKGAMRALLDATLASGGGMQQFSSAMLAVQQMAGKGTVNLQDLKLQLGQAIPSAIPILAQSLGITVPALLAKVESGSLDATTGINALVDGFTKAFGGTSAKQMDTFAGATSQLANSWEQFKLALGEAGVYQAAIDGVKALTVAVNLLVGAVKTFSESSASGLTPESLMFDAGAFTHVAKAVGEYEQSLNALPQKVRAFADAQAALDRQNRETQGLAAALAALGPAYDLVIEATKTWDAEAKKAISVADEMDTMFSKMSSSAEITAQKIQKVADSINNTVFSLGPLQTSLKQMGLDKIGNQIAGAGQGVADALGAGGMGGAVATAGLTIAIQALTQVFQAMMHGLMQQWQKVLDEITSLFDEFWNSGLDEVVGALVEVLEDLRPVFHLMGQVLHVVMIPIARQLEAINQLMKNGQHIMTQLMNVLKPLADAVKKLADTLGSAGKGIGNAVGGLAGGVGSVVSGIGHALGFADGGLITPGRMLSPMDASGGGLIYAHAGETVVPSNGVGGGSGITFNITGGDAMGIAREVRKIVEELRLTGRLGVV